MFQQRSLESTNSFLDPTPQASNKKNAALQFWPQLHYMFGGNRPPPPLKAYCVRGGVPPAARISHKKCLPTKSLVHLWWHASGASKFTPKTTALTLPPKSPVRLWRCASGSSNFSPNMILPTRCFWSRCLLRFEFLTKNDPPFLSKALPYSIPYSSLLKTLLNPLTQDLTTTL